MSEPANGFMEDKWTLGSLTPARAGVEDARMSSEPWGRYGGKKALDLPEKLTS